MKTTFLFISLFFLSFDSYAVDRTKDGKNCVKNMGPINKSTYIALMKKEGKLVTAIRTDQIMKMGDKEMHQNSTVQFDDGESLVMQTWNRGVLMKPIKTGSAYAPKDIEDLIKVMAPITFGSCSDWKVDTSIFKVPTAEEIKQNFKR